MINRRKTRTVNVGGVKIGSSHPVSIQSMAKTDTRDVKRTVAEIKKLEKAGCEIVRVAVKDAAAARAIKAIKKEIDIPLVADIHFDWRLAAEAIKTGADKIRVNPGNMPEGTGLKEVIALAKKRKVPMRLGLNSGSIGGGSGLFLKTTLKYIKLFEKESFRDIIISLKSSDVRETVASYKALARSCDYPFHLGVTAAGPYDTGIVKSSIAVGALLLDGIGDTIRVSLTGDAVLEVIAAKRILQSLKLRRFGPDIISCPTCGRCRVNLIRVVKDLERGLSAFSFQPSAKRKITIAVMGCEVNGPGEAREADIGIAAGKGVGILFKKGKALKRIKEKDFVKEIIKGVKLIAEGC